MQKLIFVIPPEQDKARLDRALTAVAAAQYEGEGLSRARLQSLMADGRLTLANKVVDDASSKVKAGEEYVLALPPPEPAEPVAQNIALDIVYEDDDVIVINKPVGLVVHPAPGNQDNTLVNALLAHCGSSLSGIGGVARPGIVHRLDKETSGLMVVAKNDNAHQKLSAQFSDRSLSRTYQAIVWGIPNALSGSVDAPIGRHAKDRKKMAVTAKGKEAVTHYKVLETFGDDFALIECQLETGRTHQIRVHMAHVKHPIVGDPVYGKKSGKKGVPKAVLEFPYQALHAAKLQFIHPTKKKMSRHRAEMPPEMKKLLAVLKKNY